MTESNHAAVGYGVWAGVVLLIGAALALPPPTDGLFILAPIAISFAGVGGFLVHRRHHDPVGWLLSAFGLMAGIQAAGTQYAYRGIVVDRGSLPAPEWVGKVAVDSWHPAFGLFLFALLLFPTGALPSPRWRRLAWAVAAVYTGLFLSGLFEVDFAKESLPFLDPPSFGRVSEVANGIFGALLVLNVVVVVCVCFAVFIRLRRARDEERLQMKWLTFALALVVPSLPLSLLIAGDGTLFVVLLPLLPISIAIAILKYRLYDIDVVVNRTLVYGCLTAIVLAVYIGVVAVLEDAFRRRADFRISLAATAVVAVAFAPLRDRVQTAVDRVVYGERKDPYGVLTRLARRLESSMTPAELLPTVVTSIGNALKLPYVAVEVKGEDGFVTEAAYGTLRDTSMRVPLRHRGEDIGALVLERRPGTADFSPSEHRLLADLAAQIGVATEAVALTRALQGSRERLVVAREEERRRLRRDLHDGLGPTLTAATMKVDRIRDRLPHDPADADRLLHELRVELRSCIDDIRRLVYELRPPALDELGLVGALREQAARYVSDPSRSNGMDVHFELPETLPELPAAAEVAAYRIVAEAITNAARHSGARRCTVDVIVSDGDLCIDIADDGAWPHDWKPGVGITSMRERAAELGGSLSVGPHRDGGGRVVARIPLGRP